MFTMFEFARPFSPPSPPSVWLTMKGFSSTKGTGGWRKMEMAMRGCCAEGMLSLADIF
jgi:hypothetical protein